MTLIEGSTRVESKTSQTIIINLKFLDWKFLFEIKMLKIFFSKRKQVYEKVGKRKQINSITTKTKTSLWRKKTSLWKIKQINVVLKQINSRENTFMNHFFFVWFFLLT